MGISLPLSEIKEPAYKRMESSIVPDFVHSYDSCVLKSSFSNWIKPLVVVHDCFKVLPNDMDLAKERIRHGFVHTCSGDPLAKLADDLGITEEELPRLQQGSGRLEDVLNSSYMFN
jgi:DNA-directed RNA polymerase